MKKYVIVLLHLAYWLTYFLLVNLLVSALSHGRVHFGLTQFKHLMSVPIFLPALIGFYAFYLILFERFLAKKKIILFFLSLVFIVLLSPTIVEVILYSFGQMDKSLNTIIYSGLFLSFLTLVNGILGLVMKGFITWYDDIKIKAELDKKNYEMELALMKAQINPHFLFNTINNIDVLILKDANKASEYLNKLSDIMRFMLYETKTDKISLEKELSYIEKYVELQKIRTSNPDFVKLEMKGNSNGLQIEPMLFIPFIENAFKHSENKKVENAIRISFSIENRTIIFECENAYSSTTQLNPEFGGLGNELIRKRLALLYPNKHTFEATHSNGTYKVRLQINCE